MRGDYSLGAGGGLLLWWSTGSRTWASVVVTYGLTFSGCEISKAYATKTLRGLYGSVSMVDKCRKVILASHYQHHHHPLSLGKILLSWRKKEEIKRT